MSVAGLGSALAYAVLQNGGSEPSDWRICALIVAALAVVYFGRSDLKRAPTPRPSLLWPMLLLPCYAVLQLLPLPIAFLRVASPARAELIESMDAVLSPATSGPLSVVPPVSLQHLLRILTCALVFLLVREIVWRSAGLWWAALPIVAVAVAEAALGIAQFYSTGQPAHGTYVNANHYSGLLEMALPFAAVYPAVVLIRARSSRFDVARLAPSAFAGISVAVVILLGIVHSFSRMGFAAACLSLCVAGAGIVAYVLAGTGIRRRTARLSAAGCAALILAGFIFLAPERLIDRFGKLSSVGITSTDRMQLWRETVPLIAAYPLFGCGLGGYESAFMKFKISGPAITDDYAHCDYLQYLAELGFAGFAIAAVLVLAVLAEGFRTIRTHPDPEARCLAVACVAAWAGILVHSLVDFNSYVPSNALCLAWISGMAASAGFPLTRQLPA